MVGTSNLLPRRHRLHEQSRHIHVRSRAETPPSRSSRLRFRAMSSSRRTPLAKEAAPCARQPRAKSAPTRRHSCDSGACRQRGLRVIPAPFGYGRRANLAPIFATLRRRGFESPIRRNSASRAGRRAHVLTMSHLKRVSNGGGWSSWPTVTNADVGTKTPTLVTVAGEKVAQIGLFAPEVAEKWRKVPCCRHFSHDQV